MKFTKLKSKSLKQKIRKSYIFIIVIMIIPTMYSVIVSNIHSKRYDTIITNVSKANAINEIAKEKIPQEIWNIIAGRTSFNSGRQYIYISEIMTGIDEIMLTTSEEDNAQKLLVAKRTSQTLYRNVNELGTLMANDSSVKQNQEKLEDIRSITSLLSDVMQNFIIAEIESAEKTNNDIKKASLILTVIQAVISISTIIISVAGFLSISRSIQKPISDMEDLSNKITAGDFTATIETSQIEELKQLSLNLNTMGTKMQNLMEQNIQKQKNLQKAEMKLLQAQITPHFLYNTLDTIIWLTEEDENDEAIRVTKAFSEYLRTTLSRGHEWITIEQEIKHVSNYLTIQKIRYGQVLNYTIDYDKSLKDFYILKLSLQPLVENAIYHGIKNKRGRGNLTVKVYFTDESCTFITFEITDDGIGFSRDKLEEVQKELSEGYESEKLKKTYGLYNINRRLRLYFNNNTDGLHIISTYGQGTRIYFTIPVINKKDESDV